MAFRIDVENSRVKISIEQMTSDLAATITLVAQEKVLCRWDVTEKFLRTLSRAFLVMADQIHVPNDSALKDL